MSRVDLPSIYNPGSQTPQELIDNFVVRIKLFQDVYNDIKNSDMTYPQQPYIIQGVRGQGKTTFLLRIAYEIERDEELSKQVISVCFNEEQYNISRLFKLWETVAEYLEEEDEFKGFYQKMQDFGFDEDYEEKCFELLENSLKKNNKKLILFIDNIDDLINKFSRKDQHRLREIFSESPEIRIIGASSAMLEFHYDYGHPFYQFFRMEQLKGLTAEETRTLLLRLGEYYKRKRVKEIVHNQPGRVEALRRLSSGVIRTIVLLFQIFVDDIDGNAFMDLEKILDQATPLYKYRMEKLSPQHQEIVDVIGLNWDAITAKEIAEKTKMSSKAVSAQLKQLEKYRLIEREKSSTKNYLYRIHERFFNIWYLMRRGKKWDEKRVRFFVEFLEIWCDNKALGQRALKHIESLKSGTIYDKHALFMTEALAHTHIKRELQDKLIKETQFHLEKSKSELKRYLSMSDKELIKKAEHDYKRENFEQTIKHIKKIKHKDKNDYFALGELYRQSGKDLKQAEKYYRMAVDKGHAWAMNNLAGLFFEEKRNKEKALEYAQSAYNKNKKDLITAHTYAAILIWNNEFDKSIEIVHDFIENKKYIEKHHSYINFLLLLLISKRQYYAVKEIFDSNPHNLKDRFKPVYYALLYFMQDEYPNHYRKMGSELRETVDEIIKEIKKLEKEHT
ncbi:MAG: hypothetical protein ACOC5F_04025 [Candidatus Aminicenantaceae bacterium]